MFKSKTFNKPKILSLDSKYWAIQAANYINDFILTNQTHTSFAVGLTGGRIATEVYRAWRSIPDFKRLNNVNFYVGDERFVQINSESSNTGLVMRELFRNGVPAFCSFVGIDFNIASCCEVARDYDSKLPEHFDLLLLTVGDDGHVASIFANYSERGNNSKFIEVLDAPIQPCTRLTITPSYIKKSTSTIVFCIGKTKRQVLKHLTCNTISPQNIPANLVRDATWLVD